MSKKNMKTFAGKVSGDEIKFTRTVAESIKEELVAKRVKESNAKQRKSELKTALNRR